MTHTITLRKSRFGWSATFHDDATIYKLFRTYTLPTAFRAAASYETVRSAIQFANPRHTITRGMDR